MFEKRDTIRPMADPAPRPAAAPSMQPSRIGGAVDHVAAVSAVAVAGLGVVQLMTPIVASPFTGIEGGMAGTIIAVQWIAFGLILALGGLFRMRVVTIFAAEFLLVSGLAATGVALFAQNEPVPLLLHGAVALVGFVNSGLARLTDKAELNREIKLMRAHAQDAMDPRRQAESTPGLGASAPSSGHAGE